MTSLLLFLLSAAFLYCCLAAMEMDLTPGRVAVAVIVEGALLIWRTFFWGC
jgi:hypothetical protein